MKNPKKNTIPFFLAKIKNFFVTIKKDLKEKWSSIKQKRKEKTNQSDSTNSALPSQTIVESKQPNANPETLDDKFIGVLLAIKGWVVMKGKNTKNAISKKQPKKEKNNKEENTRSNRSHSFIFGFNVAYNVFKNLFIALVVFILIGVAFVGGAGLGYFAYLVSNDKPPTYKEMNADLKNIETTSSIYYANNELISDLRTDLKRTTMPLKDMSDLVEKAIIATEDEYFYEHHGVVPKAVARALFQEVSGSSSVSGGSTLTQQLVKQQILTNEVSFKRKANEILLAYRLENFFSKEEILESYLNVSPFGRNNHGENIAG
ncbi:MAG: transglycosylase domain-containing protein, partial [Carnobacterium sp.]